MGSSQTYIKNFGKRKCEANSLIVKPKEARALMEKTIIKYLKKDAPERFQKKRDDVKKIVDDFRNKSGINDFIQEAIDKLSDY